MKDGKITDFDFDLIHFVKYLFSKNVMDKEMMRMIVEMDCEHRDLCHTTSMLGEKCGLDPSTNLFNDGEAQFGYIMKSMMRMSENIRSHRSFNLSCARIALENVQDSKDSPGPERRDKVMKDMGELLASNSRLTDYINLRADGDIDIILPGTAIEGAVSYIEKIYTMLKKQIYYDDNSAVPVTATAGLAAMSMTSDDMKKLYSGDIELRFAALKEKAAAALSDARISGTGNYKIFTEDVDVR